MQEPAEAAQPGYPRYMDTVQTPLDSNGGHYTFFWLLPDNWEWPEGWPRRAAFECQSSKSTWTTYPQMIQINLQYCCLRGLCFQCEYHVNGQVYEYEIEPLNFLQVNVNTDCERALRLTEIEDSE